MRVGGTAPYVTLAPPRSTVSPVMVGATSCVAEYPPIANELIWTSASDPEAPAIRLMPVFPDAIVASVVEVRRVSADPRIR